MATITLPTDLKNQILLGTHNFNTGQVFKLAFSDTAITSAMALYANITSPIAVTNLTPDVVVTVTETGGVVTGTAKTLTSTVAPFGPFRYYALYNDTAASKNVVAAFDHGSEVTLAVGETFTIKWNNSGTTGTIFSVA